MAYDPGTESTSKQDRAAGSLSKTAPMSSWTDLKKPIMLNHHGGQLRSFFAKLFK